jgi:hypothetical protein
MNAFEYRFFEKYVPEGQKIKWVVHKHILDILMQIFLWMSMAVLLPSFLYYYSGIIQNIIPFYILEIWLILMFIKIIYDMFDWYNDVWVITNEWVVELNWKLFWSEMTTVRYENVEWIEVQQDGIIDTVFKKWDIIIHKIWDDSFVLSEANNPYDACDLIEEISDEYRNPDESSDKFDMVVETLGWMMEEYLEKKSFSPSRYTSQYNNTQSNNKNIKKSIRNEYNDDDTIDLR